MVVAMVAVRVVKTIVHQVVHVIAMRHRLVAAAGSMFVTLAPDFGSATDGVSFANLDDVLFNKLAFRMLQMSVLQIVDVVSVTDGEMTTIGIVHVGTGG
jgi:hypothetical protein